MRRRLCRRLSGLAHQPHHGRPDGCRGHHEGSRRPPGGLGLRGDGGRHAGGLGALSDPGRRGMEVDRRHQCRVGCHRQPRLGRRNRRRPHDRRRGLWRRLLDHAGAQPCLRDEEPGLAPRSAPQPAGHREGGRGRVRAVRGLQHARHARSAHPLLPHARTLHGQGQYAPRDDGEGGAGEPAPRHQPHRPAARLLPPRAREDREALAGRGSVHPRARTERDVRASRGPHRHRLPGRHV